VIDKTLIVGRVKCGSLKDKSKREDFMEEISEEYEEIRDEHYDSLKVKSLFLTFLFSHCSQPFAL